MPTEPLTGEPWKGTELVVNPGVGMPADLLLEDFGVYIWSAFGEFPYLVGSALMGKKWRDIDVRLILDDDVYESMGLGDPRATRLNRKWVALVLAFSTLGREMTGLPIDFQIQQQTDANRLYSLPRSALGITKVMSIRSGELT